MRETSKIAVPRLDSRILLYFKYSIQMRDFSLHRCGSNVAHSKATAGVVVAAYAVVALYELNRNTHTHTHKIVVN